MTMKKTYQKPEATTITYIGRYLLNGFSTPKRTEVHVDDENPLDPGNAFARKSGTEWGDEGMMSGEGSEGRKCNFPL